MKARKVPRLMLPRSASHPPSASMPTCPSAGTAASALVYRLVKRTARIRSENRARAAVASLASSRSSCPKPLTTRTPAVASATTAATSPACCWAAQVAGKTVRRARSPIMITSGPTASASSVSNGDNNIMITMASTNSSRFPLISGRNASRPWTTVTSELARLTTWPVRRPS